jgi:hypothetical protein
MPEWHPPSEHDAAERARAWLIRQHDQAHAEVLRLLGEAPTEAISQALDRFSTAELRALHRHIAAAAQRWVDQPDATDDGL